MKSEPSVYAITDLARDSQTLWDGVRNYQARNFMRQMAVNDRVLFYHSNADEVGIAGLARVSALAKADPTQFDARSEFFDATAKRDDPRWAAVEIRFEERFAEVVTLDALRSDRALAQMMILRRGNRLSVTPVTASEFSAVIARAHKAVRAVKR